MIYLCLDIIFFGNNTVKIFLILYVKPRNNKYFGAFFLLFFWQRVYCALLGNMTKNMMREDSEWETRGLFVDEVDGLVHAWCLISCCCCCFFTPTLFLFLLCKNEQAWFLLLTLLLQLDLKCNKALAWGWVEQGRRVRRVVAGRLWCEGGGVKGIQGSSLGRRETMSPRRLRGLTGNPPWRDSRLGKCCRRIVLCTCKWTERRGERWKERWLKAASDCLDAHLSVPSHPADVSDVSVNVAPPASSVQRLLRRPRRSAKPPQLLYASVAPPTSWRLNCFSTAAPPTRWPTFLATALFLCVRVLLPTDSFCNSLW